MKPFVIAMLSLLVCSSAQAQEGVNNQEHYDAYNFTIFGHAAKVLSTTNELQASGTLKDGSKINFECSSLNGCSITVTAANGATVGGYQISQAVNNLSVYEYHFGNEKATQIVLGYIVPGGNAQSFFEVAELQNQSFKRIFFKGINNAKVVVAKNLILTENPAQQISASGWVYLASGFYQFTGPAKVFY